MSTIDKTNACRRCVYAMKNYFTIGNRFFLKDVSQCTYKRPNCNNEKPFKENKNCLYFKPDVLSACNGDTEQYMLYISRQLDNIEDMLIDVVAALYPDEDDGDLLKLMNKDTDK